MDHVNDLNKTVCYIVDQKMLPRRVKSPMHKTDDDYLPQSQSMTYFYIISANAQF